jgi:hypothetical protein
MSEKRITLWFEGDTWAEIVAQAREVIGGDVRAPVPASLPSPQPLPFEKPASGLIPPPEYVCPEHNQPMRHKPAGVNRQGTPYAAGFRCPVAGCRQFVPDVAA